MSVIESSTATAFTSVRSKEMVDPYRFLKLGIWVYFLLLIFEGALRKWFLPGLATPLLIIRDPIALWLVVTAWRRGLLQSNLYLNGMVLVGLIGIYTAVLLGHGNLPVAFYGARILLLHFPLIFVIGRIFNREDVIKMGKVTLWISIPMVILITAQFYSPQSAWVNRGIGGDIGGGGFDGALGFFRPPATFSFTNGTSLFFAFAASFIFYFWLTPKSINSLLLISATTALLLAIPFSISRSLFFHIAISLVFATISISRKPEYGGRIIMIGLMGLIVLVILSKSPFFQTATEAFTSRFENANEAEGGLKGVLGDRYFGGLLGAFMQSSELPFFGYGLGMGTNVGSMLLAGKQVFLISEGEWGRTIGELGSLLGLTVIFFRLGLSAKIALASYRRLALGDVLPWMLLSFGIVNLPQGGWAQPTSLGFCTLIGGLLIASLRVRRRQEI